MLLAPYIIRPAQEEEAATLTELALRAKAYWGYSAEFMAAARPEMTVTPAMIRVHWVMLAATPSTRLGFYQLRDQRDGVMELVDLFIDPPFIGHGVGRALWQDAVARARALGYHTLVWESDPHAAGFYTRMGARQTGATESPIQPGRMLPRFTYTLR
jgi:GNAT superfamily N-acetyltransferase